MDMLRPLFTFLTLTALGSTPLPAQMSQQTFLTGHFSGGEGALDSIVVNQAQSSMVSGTWVIAKDGETDEVLQVCHEHWFSEFLSLVQLPAGYNQPRWQPYRTSIDSVLGMGQPRLSGKEPDLRWLTQAYQHQLEGDSLFDRYYAVPLQWQPAPVAPPSQGWYYLDEQQFPLFHNPLTNDRNHDSSATTGWLHYRGDNHFLAWTGPDAEPDAGSYRKAWHKRRQTLWHTAHGLIWQEGDRYAWLFTSTGSLTGGPQKLRWPSLYQIEMVDGFILAHHMAPVMQWNQLFLIDPTTGLVGDIELDEKIKIGTYDQLDFSVENDTLIVLRSPSKFVPESYEARLDWQALTQQMRCKAEGVQLKAGRGE